MKKMPVFVRDCSRSCVKCHTNNVFIIWIQYIIMVSVVLGV